MDEKVQVEEGINLMDIVRLLLSKLFLLIFVALASGLLGGFVAVAKTIDVDFYGTSVEFYVNPEKPKDVVGGNGSQYGVYGAYGRHVMDNIVKLLSSESFAEILIDGSYDDEVIAEPMNGIPQKYKLSDKGEQYMTSEYKNFLYLVKNSVHFSYLESDADIDDANNLARSFIYVKISVINDKEFAESLLDSVRVVVPWYVEENMTVPSDYSGTNCQKITVMEEIHLTNPGYTSSQAIKYGILFAFAACAVTSIIIIVVDKSDKRLRDYELVMRNLDVPVLGVIPTIEPMVEKAKAAAKAARNGKSSK